MRTTHRRWLWRTRSGPERRRRKRSALAAPRRPRPGWARGRPRLGAAAAGARALGASIEEVQRGLLDFRPISTESPGRLNIFRNGDRVAIIDFAHNEAGVSALLDVAEGIAAGAGGRVSPITIIIGTAGDRPDDTLRGIGRIAGEREHLAEVEEGVALVVERDELQRAACDRKLLP